MAHSGYYTETSNYENVNDVLAEVEAYKNEAETAATNASLSADQADLSETQAAAYAAGALASANSASNAEISALNYSQIAQGEAAAAAADANSAQLAADSSQTYSLLSSEYRDEALVYRNQAEVFKNQAEAATVDKITGPASAVDNEVVRFDGTTGKLAKAGLKYQTSVTDTTSGALSLVGAFGLGTSGISSPDLDSIIVSGFYKSGSGATGTPATSILGHNVYYQGDSSFGTMVAVGYDSGREFVRVRTSGTWGAWIEVLRKGAFGLGGSSVNLSNADTEVETGFYTVTGSTTGTLPASTGVLLHMERGSSNAAFQIFSGLVGTGNPQRVWTRSRRSDSVWTAWSEQWTSTGTNTILVDTGSVGFGTGSGGTVTQATSKATAVTLNKPSGQITMNAAALAASTVVSFTFTNNKIAVGDVIQLSIAGGATGGAYNLSTSSIAAGSCVINLRNLTAGSLSEAVVINFVILKGATA